KAAGEVKPPSKIPHRPDIAPAPGLRAGRDGISFNRRPVPERREIMWFSSRLRNRKRHESPRMRPACRPRLEALEDRCLPSTLTASNRQDGGKGWVRYEIAAAQSGDTIVFDFGNKKSNSRPHTITLASPELYIDKNLTIQGPGAGLLEIYGAAEIGGE